MEKERDRTRDRYGVISVPSFRARDFSAQWPLSEGGSDTQRSPRYLHAERHSPDETSRLLSQLVCAVELEEVRSPSLSLRMVAAVVVINEV